MSWNSTVLMIFRIMVATLFIIDLLKLLKHDKQKKVIYLV